MSGIDRIDRRTALTGLAVATMLAGSAAKAQRGDASLTQIKTTDLGRKTYMLEGQGGNILVVIGDDGIIMVDAELAPLHDKIKAAITGSSELPIKCLVDTHFHGEQTGGNAPFHRDGAIIVAQDKLATGETKITSSRGGMVAGRAQVAEFRDMLATARDRMSAMVGKGMTEDEALAAKPFADLDAKWAGSERDAANFVRMVYNSFQRA